jgi:hypothetical protein
VAWHGLVRAADSTSLSLKSRIREVELASTRIMRVDRLASEDSAVKDGARGAAFGAGVVGVIGLIVGKVPPARLFAAGGIIGAYNNVEARCHGPQKRDDLPRAGGGADCPGEAQLSPRAMARQR